jgi:hypothetical protein
MPSPKQLATWFGIKPVKGAIANAIQERLGELPDTAVDFVRLYCQSQGIHIDLQASVVLDALEDDSISELQEPEYDDDSAWDYNPIEIASYLSRPTLFDLRRDLRLCNNEISAGYEVGVMDAALQKYIADVCQTRVAELIGNLKHDRHAAQTEFVKERWVELAWAVFDEPMLSLSARIAVMQGLIWQMKRKLIHRKVLQHFMWVLIARQGSGKSTFYKHFTSPLHDGRRLSVSFDQILDDRYIALWKYSYFLFLDEMQSATSANRDRLKNIITAESLTRRPLRTNQDIQVQHNATFGGAANDRFADLIKDPTGIRRFIPTRTKRKMEWGSINDMDYTLLWRSVNELSNVNPASEYWDEISQLQEANRVKTQTEEWAFYVANTKTKDDGWLWKAYEDYQDQGTCFDAFRRWEDANYPKGERTPRRYFYEEMRDIAADGGNGWDRSRESFRYIPTDEQERHMEDDDDDES